MHDQGVGVQVDWQKYQSDSGLTPYRLHAVHHREFPERKPGNWKDPLRDGDRTMPVHTATAAHTWIDLWPFYRAGGSPAALVDNSVYARNFESVDQDLTGILESNSPLTTEWKPDLLKAVNGAPEGVIVIKGSFATGSPLLAIPNHARNNRKVGTPSIVWIKDQ